MSLNPFDTQGEALSKNDAALIKLALRDAVAAGHVTPDGDPGTTLAELEAALSAAFERVNQRVAQAAEPGL